MMLSPEVEDKSEETRTDVAGEVVVALLPFELLLLMAAVTEKTRRIAQLFQEIFVVIFRSKGHIIRAVQCSKS